MPKVAQRPHDHLRVIEQVRNNDDHATSGQFAGEFAQHLVEMGFALWSRRFQMTGQGVHMLHTIAWWNIALYLRTERHQTDVIPLTQHQIRKGSGQIATVVKLAEALRTIVHRRTGVDEQVGPEVGFLFVLFDEIAVELAVGLPINVANFITWNILPMFGK